MRSTTARRRCGRRSGIIAATISKHIIDAGTNKIFLQGRLTKEPEIRLTSKNDKVARFTIAVDRDFNREETDFINCVAFKATAAFIESYFTKGDMIIVCGRLHMQQYTAKDGSNRTAAEVMTDNVWFCGGKGKTKDAATDAQLVPVEDDEALPF